MHFLDHIWTFVTDVVNVYIYSIILQILMNMVEHVEAFKSGLVSRVMSFCPMHFKFTNFWRPFQFDHSVLIAVQCADCAIAVHPLFTEFAQILLYEISGTRARGIWTVQKLQS